MSAVATTFTFCGMQFPRNPTDVARDRWIEQQLPLTVAALEASDKALTAAFADMRVSPALLDAYRGSDDATLARIVRAAVRAALAEEADLQLQDDAYARFPERSL